MRNLKVVHSFPIVQPSLLEGCSAVVLCSACSIISLGVLESAGGNRWIVLWCLPNKFRLVDKHLTFFVSITETHTNFKWRTKAKSGYSRCIGRGKPSVIAWWAHYLSWWNRSGETRSSRCRFYSYHYQILPSWHHRSDPWRCRWSNVAART